MKVSLKELRESLVWLKVIERAPLCKPELMTGILLKCNELVSIFTASVKTAEKNK